MEREERGRIQSKDPQERRKIRIERDDRGGEYHEVKWNGEGEGEGEGNI